VQNFPCLKGHSALCPNHHCYEALSCSRVLLTQLFLYNLTNTMYWPWTYYKLHMIRKIITLNWH
jgi:hypothetical protein